MNTYTTRITPLFQSIVCLCPMCTYVNLYPIHVPSLQGSRFSTFMVIRTKTRVIISFSSNYVLVIAAHINLY